jgi:hypothetical protein
MAARGAIIRLSDRIDALAYRRRGRFTLNQLTDGAWQKLEVLSGLRIGPCHPMPGAEQWPTDELIRFLVEAGVLTVGDFKGATNGHTLCG